MNETIAMQKSPLGRLPPELRLEIFEYVFTYERLACKDGSWEVTRPGERTRRSLTRELGATRVCKQMRQETRHLPLVLNDLVCGDELGYYDPWYEWWNTSSLTDPCPWAYKTLTKLTPLLSDSTTFKLHLWAYPAMLEKMGGAKWKEIGDAFAALVSVLGPAKLIVTLHLRFHFIDLPCKIMNPLIGHGEAVFEVHAGRSTATKEGMSALTTMVIDKRKEIRSHGDHLYNGHCGINSNNNTLLRQLMDAEHVCRRFMSLAIWASTPGETSTNDLSEVKDDLPSAHQEARRDSTRPRSLSLHWLRSWVGAE